MTRREAWAGATLLVVAGLAQGLSLSWPWSLGLPVDAGPAVPDVAYPQGGLQGLSLAALAWVLLAVPTGRGGRRDLWTGLLAGTLFATVWFCVAFGWVYGAMHTYGGLPALPATLATLALALFLALIPGLMCMVFVAWSPVEYGFRAIYFGACWLLAELGRGVLLSGFGWGAVPYAQVDGPLAAWLPWVGSYGVSAWVAGLSMALALVLRHGRAPGAWRPLLLGVCLAVLPGLWGARFTEPAGRMSVTLLQGNIPQDEKFEPGSGVPLALDWYAQQLQQATTALVVAPETAIPLLPQQLPAGYWESLTRRFGQGGQAALVGMPLGDLAQGYTNSVLGLRPGADAPWRYDKHHLVPFGEYIPTFFRWFTDLMHIPLGDFSAGPLGQPPFEWQGQRLAANVCYEDLFGEELAVVFRRADQQPTAFVNVSNLGWFGTSLALDQHLHIARVRAREFERPFLLATNTGLTGIVDHEGRLQQVLPRHRRAVLQGEFEGRHGLTPYAAWVARAGLWPYGLLAGVVLLLAVRSRAARRRQGPGGAGAGVEGP